MPEFHLSAAQHAQFDRDGYLIVPGLFAAPEVGLLGQVARSDHALLEGARDKRDTSGRTTRLTLRYELDDDIYCAVVASRRVVETCARLMGGPVCHFHHKMMLKEPYVGGAWEWHQDYGYWYRHEGFLFPDLVSCMVAVDRANRENGCLQVIRGSHRLGRIEHGVVADQTGADGQRVEAVLGHLDLIYVELEPGDACFFHSNLLHRSDANTSPNPRWSLIGCFYRADNPACVATQYNGRPALEPWPDDKVLSYAAAVEAGGS